LRDTRVDAADMDSEALSIAAAHGHLECTEMLMAYDGIDPAADGNYALAYAVANQHDKVAQMLLDDARVVVELLQSTYGQDEIDDPLVSDDALCRVKSPTRHNLLVSSLLEVPEHARRPRTRAVLARLTAC
jgi:hypothetical protein